MKAVILLLALLLGFGPLAASDYKVAFETMSCNGDIGFAVVSADAIHKIEKGDCADPDDTQEYLMRMLVKDGSGSFAVYTLTRDEARAVMKEIKSYMRARRKALESSETVIIEQ